MLSVCRLFSSLFLCVSEAPRPDHNLTDGSYLLHLSNQNLQINWVTACTLATVPSISQADEGSLVKLRLSTEAWRPVLPKKELCFLFFHPHCELLLSTSQIYCFISNYKNKQELHSNKGVGAQALTECSANSFYDWTPFKNLLWAVSICVPFFLLIYLLPSLSNMLTF